MIPPIPTDEAKLAALREALPALSAGIYLNTAEAGPLPAETARAMAEAADWELRTGRAHPAAVDDRAQRLDEARATYAAILHATVDSVAVTHSAADALAAIVASGLQRGRGGAGRRVAVSRDLNERVLERLRHAAAWIRGTVVEFEAFDVPPGVERAIVPHVSPIGAVAPLADLVARVPEVLVDGSLAAGAIPVDVLDLGVAGYASDAHRWLLGPAGMAAVHVGGTTSSRRALEATQFHGPSVLGMARSAGWLAMYVGLDWLASRTAVVARRLADRLAPLEHVEVVTPMPPPAGIVAFRLTRWDPDEAFDELGRRSFAILGLLPGGLLRASVGGWNTDAEVDRFAESVALLAGHTSATVPRRASLTILHDGGG